MNVFFYLEDVFVRLYFLTQFYIQLAPLLVQIDVSTTQSDLYYKVEYFKTNSFYASLFVRYRSLSVSNTDKSYSCSLKVNVGTVILLCDSYVESCVSICCAPLAPF